MQGGMDWMSGGMQPGGAAAGAFDLAKRILGNNRAPVGPTTGQIASATGAKRPNYGAAARAAARSGYDSGYEGSFPMRPSERRDTLTREGGASAREEGLSRRVAALEEEVRSLSRRLSAFEGAPGAWESENGSGRGRSGMYDTPKEMWGRQ